MSGILVKSFISLGLAGDRPLFLLLACDHERIVNEFLLVESTDFFGLEGPMGC